MMGKMEGNMNMKGWKKVVGVGMCMAVLGGISAHAEKADGERMHRRNVLAGGGMDRHWGGGKMKPRYQGQRGPRGKAGRFFKRVMRRVEQLELTDQQIKQLRALIREGKRARIQKHAERKLLAVDLEEAFRQEKPDFAKAKRLITKMHEVTLALRLSMLNRFKEGYQLLTKEQRGKMRQHRRGGRKKQ